MLFIVATNLVATMFIAFYLFNQSDRMILCNKTADKTRELRCVHLGNGR
jgi:hypothetical protein